MMTRLDVCGAAAAGTAPAGLAATLPGTLGWVLLLTMSTAAAVAPLALDSTQFWQFWTYSRVRWYVSEPMVVWVPAAVAATAGIGAAAWGTGTDSGKPVGVEGRGGVWRLLSMGFAGGCGF